MIASWESADGVSDQLTSKAGFPRVRLILFYKTIQL
jgi:hypothetical protein